MSVPTALSPRQVVGLELGGETYGVEISRVQEIVRLQPITPVPHAPANIEGVTNLRGQIVPIVDLRKRCGLRAGASTQQTRIVVADLGTQIVGLVVDGVSEILPVSEEQIEAPDTMVTGDDPLVAGIARLAERLILLLDTESIMQPPKVAS